MTINKTLETRGSKYGAFSDNARITQQLEDVIKTAPNYDKLHNEHKEAFHMILHKISRSVCGDPMYADNAHDIVGYAQLLEDFIIEENEKLLIDWSVDMGKSC